MTHTSFFSAQQKHNSMISPSNQIVTTTYAYLTDVDDKGIRNQNRHQIDLRETTLLINDLEM